jgi:hypothetical protein
MSDLRSEIVSKVLNSWDNGITATPPQAKTEEVSIAKKVFDFVNANPSCAVNDIVAGTGVDLARTAATTLALYQRGKLDRKRYPNPDPNGKHDNVYVYWTAIDNYTDKSVKRLMTPKKQKQKKIVITQAKPVERAILEPIFEPKRPRIQMFDPEQFVKGLSLTEVKQLHKFLESYFE